MSIGSRRRACCGHIARSKAWEGNSALATGAFRSSLLGMLAGVPVSVPPLRRRRETASSVYPASRTMWGAGVPAAPSGGAGIGSPVHRPLSCLHPRHAPNARIGDHVGARVAAPIMLGRVGRGSHTAPPPCDRGVLPPDQENPAFSARYTIAPTAPTRPRRNITVSYRVQGHFHLRRMANPL